MIPRSTNSPYYLHQPQTPSNRDDQNNLANSPNSWNESPNGGAIPKPPTFSYSALHYNAWDTSLESCSICLNKETSEHRLIPVRHTAVAVAILHKFHKACIEQAIKEDSDHKCPLCRREITHIGETKIEKETLLSEDADLNVWSNLSLNYIYKTTKTISNLVFHFFKILFRLFINDRPFDAYQFQFGSPSPAYLMLPPTAFAGLVLPQHSPPTTLDKSIFNELGSCAGKADHVSPLTNRPRFITLLEKTIFLKDSPFSLNKNNKVKFSWQRWTPQAVSIFQVLFQNTDNSVSPLCFITKSHERFLRNKNNKSVRYSLQITSEPSKYFLQETLK